MRAQQQRNLRAGLARQNRIVLSQLAPESIFIEVKQQRDFIALRVTVDNTEAALHQVFSRANHHISEPFIERRFELMHFARQPREAAPINPRHQKHPRHGALIESRFVHAHLLVQLIKLNSATPSR